MMTNESSDLAWLLVLLSTHHSLLFSIHSLFFSCLSQRIEIISFFLKQTHLDQSFDGIENCRTSVGIVLASFKQSVQIELLLVPILKASQYAFVDFFHGKMIRR